MNKCAYCSREIGWKGICDSCSFALKRGEQLGLELYDRRIKEIAKKIKKRFTELAKERNVEKNYYDYEKSMIDEVCEIK